MTCTVRIPGVSPLIRFGALKVMLVGVIELSETEVPPILSNVSEDIPVDKLVPMSVMTCDPVLVIELGVSEVIVGTAR